jgi:hypothetical protein
VYEADVPISFVHVCVDRANGYVVWGRCAGCHIIANKFGRIIERNWLGCPCGYRSSFGSAIGRGNAEKPVYSGYSVLPVAKFEIHLSSCCPVADTTCGGFIRCPARTHAVGAAVVLLYLNVNCQLVTKVSLLYLGRAFR